MRRPRQSINFSNTMGNHASIELSLPSRSFQMYVFLSVLETRTDIENVSGIKEGWSILANKIRAYGECVKEHME